MRLFFKHIGLLIGIALVFVSFLFVGRRQDTYQILLTIGLVTSLIFYLAILFGKGHLRTKLSWTVVVILSIVVQQLTEPIIIDSSYRIYIRKNKSTLSEINNILLQKSGDVIVSSDTVIAKNDRLTSSEISQLQIGRERLGVYQLYKFDKGIYFGLWGFLDVRLGLTFLPEQAKSYDGYRHLTGNWFH